jgi:hypothetical protein
MTVLGPEHPSTLTSMANLQGWHHLLESGTMGRGGKGVCASDGDKDDSTRARASGHPDDYVEFISCLKGYLMP